MFSYVSVQFSHNETSEKVILLQICHFLQLLELAYVHIKFFIYCPLEVFLQSFLTTGFIKTNDKLILLKLVHWLLLGSCLTSTGEFY